MLNDSQHDFDYLFIEFPLVYRAEMHIFDDDGTELPFYPNHTTRMFLGSIGKPWATQLAQDIKERKKSALIIALPEGRPFTAQRTRLVKFVYRDGTTGDTPILSLIGIPKFDLRLRAPLEAAVRTQVVVVPPDEFDVRPKKIKASKNESGSLIELTTQDGYYATENSAFLDYSLPTGDEDIVFEGKYEIHPNREEKWLLETFYWSMVVVSLFTLGSVNSFIGGMPLVVQVLENTQISSFLQTNSVIIAQGVLVFAAAFMGLVTNPLTHRTKVWLFLPILLAIATIVKK